MFVEREARGCAWGWMEESMIFYFLFFYSRWLGGGFGGSGEDFFSMEVKVKKLKSKGCERQEILYLYISKQTNKKTGRRRGTANSRQTLK